MKSNIDNKPPHSTRKFDGIIIGKEYNGEDKEKIEYVCNFCNRSLSKLIDSSGQNESRYCNYCSISYNPDNESIKRKSKIVMPEKNTETLVASTPGTDYLNKSVEIHHEPELRGGIVELAKKGTIRVTKFEDSSQK